jgi:hypothetical protein
MQFWWMGDLVVDPTINFNLFPCLACAHNVAALEVADTTE